MNINTIDKILDLISYCCGVIIVIIMLIYKIRKQKSFKITDIILYITYIFGIIFYSYKILITYNVKYTYYEDFEQLHHKYPHEISNYSSITIKTRHTTHYILRFTYKNKQYECRY